MMIGLGMLLGILLGLGRGLLQCDSLVWLERFGHQGFGVHGEGCLGLIGEEEVFILTCSIRTYFLICLDFLHL